MTPAHSRSRALEWGIKQSLVEYVIGMPDGSANVSPPARLSREGFRFPAAERRPELAPTSPDSPAGATTNIPAEALRFVGAVTLSAHGGMLRLVFEDPWLVPGEESEESWRLTIADPYEPGSRITFATVARLDLRADGSATTSGTRLTAQGADLFLSGPYSEGTELDDPVICAYG